ALAGAGCGAAWLCAGLAGGMPVAVDDPAWSAAPAADTNTPRTTLMTSARITVDLIRFPPVVPLHNSRSCGTRCSARPAPQPHPLARPPPRRTRSHAPTASPTHDYPSHGATPLHRGSHTA